MSTERLVVLNVDDYEAGRYATTRVLRQAGFEVVEAATGEDALRLAADRPDLVVLDVNLPDIDGFEVCRRIKADAETATIPVLYLSAAYRGPEHRVQGLDLGADGYLTQPVDPRELVATVNALLRTRHVREAVEESEERFRSLMTATTDTIWTTDPSGEFKGDPQDWREFTGQSAVDTQGWGWLEAFHPDDQGRMRDRWEAALSSRTFFEIEARLRRHDGEYRQMLIRAVPVLEPDGTVREWVGANTDVTEHHRSEVALRERTERLQFLYDAANRLLLTADPREYADHLFEQLSTYLDLELYFNYLATPKGVLQLSSYRGVSPEQAEGIATLQPGEAVCGEVAARREAGFVEEVQRSLDPHTDLIRGLGVTAYACYPLVSGDQLIGTLSFGTRTRDHFTQDELALMQTVCNQVAVAVERARLISALRERATALEEANRTKADFLATMSHELRTPLNAMVGYTDLLLMGVPEPIPAASRGHVERIRSAAFHLSQLIEEVLTHARIDAGRERLHLAPTNLRDLLLDVVGLISPLTEQKGLRFTADLAGAPETVDTDPRKLRQILLNLLGNAVKFTERGEIGLAVALAGTDLVLRVRDTGIGIAPAHHVKVFEPFWQVDGTRTRVAGGTGLGLGVVRQLARRLGGEVSLESAEGAGSEFTVRLPLVPPDEDPEPDAEPHPAG